MHSNKGTLTILPPEILDKVMHGSSSSSSSSSSVRIVSHAMCLLFNAVNKKLSLRSNHLLSARSLFNILCTSPLLEQISLYGDKALSTIGLAHFLLPTTIKKLEVHGLLLGYFVAQDLLKVLNMCKRLEYLTFQGCNIEVIRSLQMLIQMDPEALNGVLSLSIIDFDLVTFTSLTVAEVPSVLRSLTALQTFHFSGNYMTSDNFAKLAPAFASLTKLHTLDLHNNAVNLDGSEALANSLGTKMLALQHLNLGDNSICVVTLAPVIGSMTALHTLELRSNNIDSVGAEALAPVLARLTALRSLDLSHNSIGECGAEALAPVLARLTALRSLDLSHNSIGERGAEALAPVLAMLAFF